MPTPNGVNYLLQSLLLLSNSPIIEQQESKVDVQSYVLISLSVHWHIYFMITQLFGKIRTSEIRVQIYEKFSISNTFYSYFNKKSSELFVDSRKSTIFAPTNPARFP